MSHVIVYDDVSNPTGMYLKCKEYAQANGSLQDGKYIPNDPDEFVIVVTDHVSLITQEYDSNLKQTLSKHQTIGKWSSTYCLKVLTKRFKWIVWNVQQTTMTSEGVENKKTNTLEPSIEDLAKIKLILNMNKELFFKYYNKKLSDREIAKLVGCSRSVVQRFRRSENLIPLAEVKRLSSLGKIKSQVSTYHKKRFTDKEMSEKIGYSISYIARIRKDLGLQANPDYYKYYNIFADKERLGALIGTVYGDATLRDKRGSFSHKNDNLDYVLQKRNRLLPIVTDTIRTISCTKDRIISGVLCKAENIQDQTVCTFKCNHHLDKLRDIIYSDKGRKQITDNSLKYLTDEGLSWYYQDDGGLNGGCPKFFMYDFNDSSLLLFRTFLEQKYDIETTKENTCQTLRVRKKDKEKFNNVVSPYMAESMLYKLR